MKYADIAQTLASKGRNGDSVLVHMTPGEVGGLQALAQSQGGSLTVNPDTGLPEAFFLAPLLGAVLPSLTAGTFLAPLFSSALTTGLTLGGVEALRTGDLGKGLSAGLGAFGGASLGGALNATGAASQAGAGSGLKLGTEVASQAGAGTPGLADMGGGFGLKAPATPGLETAGFGLKGTAPAAMASGIPTAATPSFSNMGAGLSDLTTKGGLGRFGSAFSDATGGGLGTAAAAMGLAGPLMGAMQPSSDPLAPTPSGSKYGGPYVPSEREVRYPGGRGEDSSEYLYFTPTNPAPGFRPMASGGEVKRYQSGGLIGAAMDGGDRMFIGGTPGFDTSGGQPQQPVPSSLPANFTGGALGAAINQPSPQQPEQPTPVMGGGSVSLAPNAFASGLVPPTNTSTPSRMEVGGSGWQRLNQGPRSGFNLDGTPFGPPQSASQVSDPLPAMASQFPGTANLMRYTSPFLQMMGRGNLRFRPTAPGVAFAGGTPGFNFRGGQGIRRFNEGGLAALNTFNQGGVPEGRFLQGPGDGTSDSIPANIGGTQPARLADGEFVVDARTVSELGNGSSKAGAKKLYAMMERVHSARKKAKRGKDSNAERHLPA